MKEKEKQVIYSGILGDGCLREGGSMSYNCIHKEYMDFKYSILAEYCNKGVRCTINRGYKKAEIYSFFTIAHPFIKSIIATGDPIKEAIENLDEFGLALLMYDDGSRHKRNNFYNINTHALNDYHQNLLIEKLKEFDVYPKVMEENKKDGRSFTYLYITKWNGAIELSRMMRQIDLKCYEYKLLPKQLEDGYFMVKDTEEFKSKKTGAGKMNIIKEELGIGYKEVIS